MDFEQKQRLRVLIGWAAIVCGVVVLWGASTLGAAWAIAEYKQHGEQHAWVKQQMAKDVQHEQEHAALRQLIQMVNQQIAGQQQQRPAVPAAPPPGK